MKSKKNSFKSKGISDKFLPFINDITEANMDEMNEVSITTFDKSIEDINNPLIVRGLWEKGLNRKLTAIFINILKNQNAYASLMTNGLTTVHADPDDNIVVLISDINIYNFAFENTDLDNNNKEYSFYYCIKDESADDNPEIINGRFDIDISIMYIDQDTYKDIMEEEVDYNQDCFEISYDISNKIFFNRYITEDYNNDDFDLIIRKETETLKSIFNSLDYYKINSIIDTKIKTIKDIIIG